MGLPRTSPSKGLRGPRGPVGIRARAISITAKRAWGAMGPELEQAAETYTGHLGKHCGGTSINTWATGAAADYGQGFINDLAGCRATCSAHNECLGFVQRNSDQQCSHWKSGPLSMYELSGFDCYEKVPTSQANLCFESMYLSTHSSYFGLPLQKTFDMFTICIERCTHQASFIYSQIYLKSIRHDFFAAGASPP